MDGNIINTSKIVNPYGDEVMNLSADELQKFYIEELSNCKFHISDYVEEEKHILYHRSIDRKGYERVVGVGAEGNIVVIGGLPKTRKTTLINAIVAGAYTQNTTYTFGFDLQIEEDDHILFIDTEQSKYFFYRNNVMLNKMCGNEGVYDLDNYSSYRLRQFLPFQRLEMVEHLIYNTPHVRVIALDGIADLLEDINERSEANALINRVMRWTHDTGALAILALHTSFSAPDKLTGVLGSELSKKMDSCFITTKDMISEYTKVENRLSRGVPVKPFSFGHDDMRMPMLIENSRQSAGSILM